MKRIIALVGALLCATAQTPAPSQMHGGMAAGASSGGLPAIRHLVYRFGYNTKAADSGEGTGTTTIDITGLAPDGGMMINATDDWWNSVNPKQSSTCEIQTNGNIVCPKAPYMITGIQATVVPLLARGLFKPFASNPNATATHKYNLKATFSPGIQRGFAGQVYTWNCNFSLNGAGTLKDAPHNVPLVLIHSNGQMAQQAGRYIKANGKYNIVYDPGIKVPAIVNSEWTFVPRMTVNYYTVALRLIQAGPAAQ
jgi:hypothetical protein